MVKHGLKCTQHPLSLASLDVDDFARAGQPLLVGSKVAELANAVEYVRHLGWQITSIQHLFDLVIQTRLLDLRLVFED